MKKNSYLMIVLCLIIGFSPVVNWEISDAVSRGVIWRISMLGTFIIGYLWNRREKKSKLKKFHNNKLMIN